MQLIYWHATRKTKTGRNVSANTKPPPNFRCFHAWNLTVVNICITSSASAHCSKFPITKFRISKWDMKKKPHTRNCFGYSNVFKIILLTKTELWNELQQFSTDWKIKNKKWFLPLHCWLSHLTFYNFQFLYTPNLQP